MLYRANAAAPGSKEVTPCGVAWSDCASAALIEEDRKSTRLNSSHSQISYAVFCLKKKHTQSVDARDRAGCADNRVRRTSGHPEADVCLERSVAAVDGGVTMYFSDTYRAQYSDGVC